MYSDHMTSGGRMNGKGERKGGREGEVRIV